MGRYPHIIAFAGVAQSGKTTAANITKELVDRHNSNIHYTSLSQILSYAGPIRAALEAIGVHKEENPALYREMAQYIGAKAREYDPDYWMNLMEKHITELNPNDFVIVDDVRYWNEVRQLERMGAVLIYVNPGKRMKEEIKTNPLYEHESEKMAVEIFYRPNTVAVGFRAVVTNDQDIDKYRIEVERITNKFVRDLIPVYR